MTPGDVEILEHLAFNAWPALRVVVQGGWILRFADGYTKRANSVNALRHETGGQAGALERRIDDAAALYARQDVPCVFRLSPLMDPGVDAALAGRGFTRIDETIVMRAALSGAPAPGGVEIAAARSSAWSRGYMAFNGVPPALQTVHDRMLGAIVPEAGFATAMDAAGATAAFGLGVVEARHVGLFDIVSDPAKRRAGHGRRVVEGLMTWGRSRGATHAYLQVAATNARAITLYDALGFAEAYRYHYRVPPA
ncbi:MAG: GNAT family N-acetyltransferase [Rhodospirillales bacterium]|nr:MAG: GNAT family N-acetyltransferase [Rhodospirillales bacterium]